jgi:multidrug efflux system membrane fusion protein
MKWPKLRHPARIAAGVVVLVLLALGVRMLDAPKPSEEARAARRGAQAVQVTTAAAQTQDVPIYRTGVGNVVAFASVIVHTRVDGQLDRVAFVEGQDVKAGQVLAQLDPRPIQAQLAQASAQEARDRAQLANARTDLKRYTELIAEDAATQQQVDTQKALVAQLEAAVQTDAAQVQYQRVQLGYTTIVAPIAGRTGARLVDPGNIVHAADANGIVVINQVDPIGVTFTLPEDTVQEILHAGHGGGRAPLEVLALSREGRQELARGQLVLLNNQVDTTTGTVQLKARFSNTGFALWPGQYVNVRLVLGQRAGATTVPQPAVQRGQDGPYVYVIDAQHHAQVRPIRIAQEQDGISVVDNGLKAGERVVVSGQYKLKPGMAVVETPARTPASVASRTTP